MTTPKDQLAEYRAKRDANQTPEPFGGATPSGGPRVFVVQKHAARRLHYDLRLEYDGVLRSWAVPQGPSLDPAVKRFAVQTEDHPLDYADFEGVIPAGNYGAGAMIVWDRGQFVPLPVTEKEEREGKLLFELRGHKLRGVWTLFPTQREKREWLLLKKQDGWSRRSDEFAPVETSILSGLTVEELGEGSSGATEARSEVERLNLPAWPGEAADLQPMLAETREKAFSHPDWTFELKYDGFRLIAGRDGGDPRLTYRSGRDATSLYPDVARALLSLPTPFIVLDGEVVVLEDDGRPSFQRLQRRAQLSRRLDVLRATLEQPATYYAFDLLALDGKDLRSLPLERRKELLARIVPRLGVLRYADDLAERGEALFGQIQTLGLEGIMAKRRDSVYHSGRRSDHWLKIRADNTDDFVIVGYRPPKDQTQGVGALHVAAQTEDGLVYSGRVGSGFSEADRRDLEPLFEELRIEEPSPGLEVPVAEPDRWIRPLLRCEVRYKERTDDGNLRHPVFLRLLPLEEFPPASLPSPPPATPLPPDAPTRRARQSNRSKVFWPKSGLTKGDLLDYYETVAQWMLPYLRDRPLVLDRYPDGIDGKSFYQKNAPDHAPDWVPTIEVWSGDPPKAIEYFVCNDRDTLLYLANLGAIPFHLWASRVGRLEKPDWSIIDLDPKEAPFADVVVLAREAHTLCQEIDLPAVVKTSGSTGLHVLIPLGGVCDYTQSRLLAELLARVIHSRHPKISTLARTLDARQGRVYLDYLQNRRGQLLVAPYSLRPLPEAPVSAPLHWDEVDDNLSIGHFTLQTMPERLQTLAADPVLPVLAETPNLTDALGKLALLLRSATE